MLTTNQWDLTFKDTRVAYTTFRNMKITCLDASRIVSRFKEKGDSFMHIEKSSPSVAGKPKVLCFFAHNCRAFLHVCFAMLTAYSSYLCKYKPTHKKEEYKIIHFPGTSAHIADLNLLLAEMEGIEIIPIDNGKSVNVSEIVFFNPESYFASPNMLLAVLQIRKFMLDSDEYRRMTNHGKKIAIVKTTQVKSLNTSYYPFERGHCNINFAKLQDILSKFDIVLLDHAKINFRTLLVHLMQCSLLVTSWGSTSAWSAFLRPPQWCHCIVENKYKSEIPWKKTISSWYLFS